MADWSYGGVRIYVQDFTTDTAQLIARLNPVGGGTILHIFGDDDPILKVNGYVVGMSGLLALVGFAGDAVTHTFTNPYGGDHEYLLSKITTKLQRIFCQTLDQTQAEDAPVYLVDLELFIDE